MLEEVEVSGADIEEINEVLANIVGRIKKIKIADCKIDKD
jgi:hypothetical protein